MRHFNSDTLIFAFWPSCQRFWPRARTNQPGAGRCGERYSPPYGLPPLVLRISAGRPGKIRHHKVSSARSLHCNLQAMVKCAIPARGSRCLGSGSRGATSLNGTKARRSAWTVRGNMPGPAHFRAICASKIPSSTGQALACAWKAGDGSPPPAMMFTSRVTGTQRGAPPAPAPSLCVACLSYRGRSLQVGRGGTEVRQHEAGLHEGGL